MSKQDATSRDRIQYPALDPRRNSYENVRQSGALGALGAQSGAQNGAQSITYVLTSLHRYIVTSLRSYDLTSLHPYILTYLRPTYMQLTCCKCKCKRKRKRERGKEDRK